MPKAKFLRPQADKIITLGKKETLQTTKMLVTQLQDIKSANKVKKHFLKDTRTEKVDILELLRLDLDMVIMHQWQ